LKQRIITALILAPLVVLGIFTLSLPLFKLALLAITLIGVWEWAQFVDGRSRLWSMVPAAAALLGSYLLIPSDVASLNTLVGSHYNMLVVASVWWIIASLLAITYPKSTWMWQQNKPLRHLFGILTLVPFFLEYSVVAGQ
jgi:phosphatidate cytidylyltransferase